MGIEGWDGHPLVVAAERKAAAERALRTGTALSVQLLADAERSLRKAPKAKRTGGFASKMESERAQYHEHRLLAGELAGIVYQPKFLLPGGLWYTADFLLVPGDAGLPMLEQPTVEEFKGSSKAKNARDSKTRFRIAAGLNAWARFVWVEKRDGVWCEECE